MKTAMTCRDRVRTTFARQAPDRVPINYFGNDGIHARLKAHFGVSDDDALLDALGVDFRGVGAPYIGPSLFAPVEGRHVDPLWGDHTRWIEHPTGGYWDLCDFPLRDADEETVAAWPMPDPDHFDYSQIVAQCQKYETYAISTGGPGLVDKINGSGRLRSQEQVLIDLGEGNPAGLLYMKRRSEVELEVTARTLEAARGRIDFLWIGEDLGTQIGPIMSKSTYRKYVAPHHKRFIDLGCAFNIPVMIHTCGSSSWAYDDLIEMGVSVVDTLQPEAKNMSPEYLKAQFGDRLAFHGCISTAGPVASGSVEETVAYCRRTLDIMMPGGGYAFAPTHCLQDDSPTENVVAMYLAARTVGVYS